MHAPQAAGGDSEVTIEDITDSEAALPPPPAAPSPPGMPHGFDPSQARIW